MTTDEMVTEIRALYEAMHARPDVISETRIECVSEGTSAAHGSYSAHAKTCTGALDALRGKLRAAESDALAEREAKAETLRKALGIPSPTYEARTTPPTLAERKVHQEAGGAWLVCRLDSDGKLHSDVLIGWHGWRWEGCIFMALDAERRLCAWPVGGEL